MPRKLRLEYAGARYHVTNRGDRGEPIFRDDKDRELFLDTLAEAVLKSSWMVQAYCLLDNHFHAVLQTPQPNLVAGMKWFLGTYTNRFNRRHRQRGHLFAGRYRAVPIDPSGDWFVRACDHVHLNPARNGQLGQAQRLSSYPWSSYPAYTGASAAALPWLDNLALLQACGLTDSAEGRRELDRLTEAKRLLPSAEEWAGLRRGWCYGGPEFRAHLAAGQSGSELLRHRGRAPQELAELAAERLVCEELAAVGWTDVTLAEKPKMAPEKVAIARRLRRDTILPLRWIATRLHMGSVNTARNAMLSKSTALPTPAVSARGVDAPSIAAEAAFALANRAGGPVALPDKPSPGRPSSAAPFDVSWD